MKLRESGCNQETAAAKAGFSERTGRRIEKQEHQPKKGQPRDWRTRSDPLTKIWDLELVPLLQREPELQPTTLFEYLQQKYPDQYPESIKRTLQRRVRQWKANNGPPKEVMFCQQHQPGILGLSDFTLFKQVQVTIQGKPFSHLLYHYRLAYSGWQYVQIITVRCILYTVPSRLIGHRITVHLFHDCLLLFLGRQQVLELPRVYVPTDSPLRRARSIDYRHVIDSLRRKPRAFLQSSWQQDLLPNDDYRRVWQQLIEQFAPDLACRLMVESLYIAAKQDCETAVASYLSQQLCDGTLTLASLQEQFSKVQPPQLNYPNVIQHSLHLYDRFLTYDPSQYHSRLDSSLPAQVSEVTSYASSVGNFGGSSNS